MLLTILEGRTMGKRQRGRRRIVKSTIWNVALYAIMYAADIETDGNLKEKVRSF